MALFAETPRAPEFNFNRPVPQQVIEAEYRGRHDPTEDAFQEFEFDQTIIPLEGGHYALRLQKPLMLRIDSSNGRFKVRDWGIEMDCRSLGDLPRELARRFLKLLSEAENEILGEKDQADWLRISDYVDFRQFTIDRSAPRYMEGILRSNTNLMIVEWHDGSRETLDSRAARSLSEVNPGERFSAFVRLGKDDKTTAMERVSLLHSPKENEDWESWPTRG